MLASLSVVLLLGVAFFQRGRLSAGLEPDVRLAALAQPMAETGAPVSYVVKASNWGFEEADQLVVSHTLPAGFSYQAGSTKVRLEGQVVSVDDPVLWGQTLTWGPFDMGRASGVFDNHYGVHTFVHDLCLESYVDFQLDKALDLIGPGGYVTELLYPVTVSSQGPLPCWVHFVNAAYDRNLVPIVRLQGQWGGDFWIKPEADSPGNYTSLAKAYKRVVQGLPRRKGHTLYIQVWNEPDLPLEWSGEPNPYEYGHFFVDVAAAIHSIGDARIKVLNGALTPGNASFTRILTRVPRFVESFDLWASHCYPMNHPPGYNIHDGTARYPRYTIDCYLLELRELATYGGRRGVKVMLTETGYGLYDQTFRFEGYAAISEDNRAYYMKRAFRDFWAAWPQVVAATPFELVDPYSSWNRWDWLQAGTDLPHKQYTVVKALPKPDPLKVYPVSLDIAFRATTASVPGTYYSDVMAVVEGGSITPLYGVAPVVVLDEVFRLLFPLGAKGSLGTVGDLQPELAAETVPGVDDVLDGLELPLLAEGPGEVGPVEYLRAAASPGQAPEVRGRIRLGPSPQALALDPSRGRAHVTLSEGVLTTVDTHRERVLCAVAVGGDPQGVAVNRSTGLVYVANQADGTVSVVDGSGCGRVHTITGLMRPSGVAIDEAANYVFVSDSEAGQIVVVEGESDQVVGRIGVGSYPDALAFDSHSRVLYVANAGDGTLSLIDGDSLQVVSTIEVAQGPLLGLAADGVSGRAYVVFLGPPPRRHIAAVDTRDGEVSVVLAGGWDRPLSDMYSVALDEERGQLYVAAGQELLVLDAEDLALISIAPVGATTYNSGLAVDPTSHRAYLLDSVSGELVVLGP